MSTRNLTCVVKNGEYKVAQYYQWNGYPEGVGIEILRFLRDEMYRELFENKLNLIRFGTEKELSEQWNKCGLDDSEWVDTEIIDKHSKLYPENSRDVGAGILSIIQKTDRELLLRNSLDFASDSLFCEWAYVIDLDKNTFEVYGGFNKRPLDESERFSDLYYHPDYRTEVYYPVKHVITFYIYDLPTDEEFLSYFSDEIEK